MPLCGASSGFPAARTPLRSTRADACGRRGRSTATDSSRESSRRRSGACTPMPDITPLADGLARSTSRRGFLARASRLLALAAGGTPGTPLVKPRGADAVPLFGHNYTTDSWPPPPGVPPVDAHAHPPRPGPPPDGAAADRRQRLPAARLRRPSRRRPRPPGRRAWTAARRRREADARPRRPSAATCKAQPGVRARSRDEDRQASPRGRRVVPLLRRSCQEAGRLLHVYAEPDQRRRCTDRVLLRRPARLLRHVLRHEDPVLTWSLLAVACVAGIAGTWSPCGFSIIDTISAPRRETAASCIAFAVGACAGGAATFTALAALGAAAR